MNGKAEALMEGEVSRYLDEAERKAWDSLARYKFYMFGYWAAMWGEMNDISGIHRPNPFSDLALWASGERGRLVQPSIYSYSDSVLTVDSDRHEVFCRGKEVELTPTEFRLLALLTQRAGKVCGLFYIIEDVWRGESYPPDVVKWHIARLRGKLEDDPQHPKLFITVRGVGYRYDPPAEGE